MGLSPEAIDRYDDQDISLVNHATGVLGDERDVEHVLTFDPDDVRTLGFTAVPDDINEASARGSDEPLGRGQQVTRPTSEHPKYTSGDTANHRCLRWRPHSQDN